MGLEEDFAAAAEDISNNVNKTLSDDELKEVETWFVSCCSITLLYLGICFVQARHHRRCQHFKARNAWFQGSFSQAGPFLSFIVVHIYTLSHHWLILVIDCTRSRKQLNFKFKVISLSGQGQVGCMEWKEGDGAGKANVQPTGKVWKLMDRLRYRFAIGSFWWLIFDNV